MVHEGHFLPEIDKMGHFFPEQNVRVHLKFIYPCFIVPIKPKFENFYGLFGQYQH